MFSEASGVTSIQYLYVLMSWLVQLIHLLPKFGIMSTAEQLTLSFYTFQKPVGEAHWLLYIRLYLPSIQGTYICRDFVLLYNI